ncbi:hypothetical protein ACU639_00520 [Streptomyces cynarae]|uniref:hypothetical protein n=1 Tax=Streptomyces cynarae TaxID=2981134 RepID=UPI00406D432D
MAFLSVFAVLPPELARDPLAVLKPPGSHEDLNPIPAIDHWLQDLSRLPRPFFGLVLLTAAVVFAFCAFAFTLAVLVPQVVGSLMSVLLLRSSRPEVTQTFTAVATKRRYELPVVVLSAIKACAAARKVSAEARPLHLRLVASAVSEVSRSVRKAHRTRGTITASSHRRRPLKQHAGVVVAALRAAESRLDTDTDQALTELGSLLLKIAERYVEGRLGQLLDEEELAGLQPVPDREPLRLVLAAILFGAGSVGAVFASVPEAAQTYLVGACGLLVLTLVYGRGARRALEVLATLRGG